MAYRRTERVIARLAARQEAIIAAARAEPGIRRALAGRAITREIYVPGRLVSLVVSSPGQ